MKIILLLVCPAAKGNVTMTAEFNFHTDPESAHIVLHELHTPITMACWELCLKHSLPWVKILAFPEFSISVYYEQSNQVSQSRFYLTTSKVKLDV